METVINFNNNIPTLRGVKIKKLNLLVDDTIPAAVNRHGKRKPRTEHDRVIVLLGLGTRTWSFGTRTCQLVTRMQSQTWLNPNCQLEIIKCYMWFVKDGLQIISVAKFDGPYVDTFRRQLILVVSRKSSTKFHCMARITKAFGAYI